MKPKKITKKLALNKSTVAILDNDQKIAIKGGYFYTRIGVANCRTYHPVCVTMPAALCMPLSKDVICETNKM